MDKKSPPEYRKVGGDDHHRLEELTARIDALEARCNVLEHGRALIRGKACSHCGKPFDTDALIRRDKRFCSGRCRVAHYRAVKQATSAVAQPAINDLRIKDLLTDAFEGGSNYWYRIKRCEPRDNKTTAEYEFWQLDIPLDGGALFVEVPEEGDNKEYRLDRAAIKRGLELMQAQYPHHWADFLTENDDATTGDVFLQLALFGEVIYG